LRRWDEIHSEATWFKIEGRIETDRHGRIVVIPPAAPHHGLFQSRIAINVEKLMSHGEVLIACPMSTIDGVKAADVAWVSAQRWRELGNRACFIQAPEICVEVLSPSNSEEEIREKMGLYFDAGAQEVWTCGNFGQMTFFGPGSTPFEKSKLCPEFPASI
jgi:Uma2 family endonuclease